MPDARALPPPTTEERRWAADAAASLRATLAEPSRAGERFVVHVDYSRPRRGEWLTTWSELPGLTFHLSRKAYTHTLLPGWEYNVREMRTEMIDDLERLAATGERPTKITRNA